MENEVILENIRGSEHFKLMCDTFKRMTELDLWLDSIDHDDPRSSEQLSTDYYSILVKDLNLKEQCELSHQSMRWCRFISTIKKSVTYAAGA